MLDGFTQSFKNFKDGFFRVSMEAGNEPWYLDEAVMSAYFYPHLMFNSGYLIEFVCLKSDLIDNSDN